MPNPHDLLAGVPPGRLRVVGAFLDPYGTPTYTQVAQRLELSIGTVYEHLRRLRLHNAEVYELLMARRRDGLAERHKQARRRAKDHSRRWHRNQFFRAYGYWPRG